MLCCWFCLEREMTEVQQLRHAKVALETELLGCRDTIKFLQAANNFLINTIVDSPQPGKEQNLYFQLQSCHRELENFKNMLATLHEHNDLAPHEKCLCNYCTALNEIERLRK